MSDFDKIIKDKLGSIEEMPPEHLWTNISKEINATVITIPFYKKTSVIIASVAASIAIIIGISMGIVFSNNKKTEAVINDIIINDNTTLEVKVLENTAPKLTKEDTNKPVQEIDNRTKPNKELVNEENTSPKNNDKTIKPIINNKNNDNIKEASINRIAIKSTVDPINPNTRKKAVFEIPVSEFEEESIANNNSVEAYTIAKPLKEQFTTEKDIIEVSTITQYTATENNVSSTKNIFAPVELISINNSVKVNTTTDQQIASISTNNPSDRIPKNNFRPRGANYDKYSIGAHFGLERIIDNNIKISAYNVDMSFNYQNMNFIAQTGVGFQFSDDKVNYSQQYVSNDLMDSQIRFDSIDFVDDGNGGMNPVPVSPYYEDIYDSINHEFSSDLYKAYYSIRIPLFLGYQKSFKKIAIFGKGGIIYSHIFRDDEGSINEVDESARLIDVSYENYERQNNQLQYVASTGISYSISKKLFFNVELMGKYYQYSLYKNSENSSNPWSFEARFGLMYLLN